MAKLDAVPALVTVPSARTTWVSRTLWAELPVRFGQLLEPLPAGSIVANLPNPTRTVAKVNQLLNSAVAKGRVDLADMRQIRSWRGKPAADHFHPNERGYPSIAANFAEAIQASTSI